jgi:putative flippase GtrA
MRDSYKMAARYVVVGIGNVAIDLGILTLLMRATGVSSGPMLVLFATVSFLIAILNGYYWNARWTFRVALDPRRQLLPFVLVQLVALFINDAVVSTLMNLLAGGIPDSFLRVYVAKGFAIALTAAWTFVASRFVVFRVQRGTL